MKSERSKKVSETIEQSVFALLSILSSSYGPRGLDKMLVQDKNTVITNDGATIMNFYKNHPIHKIISSVSATQDVNCGDGTTSVVLLIGCIMKKLKKLKERDIHPSKIVSALEIIKDLAVKYIDDTKTKIEEKDFINVALTTLNSKIAAKSVKMAQITIDALKIAKKDDITIKNRIGGNIDDIELFKGYLLDSKIDFQGEAKLLVIQFCISAPKTNLDSKILINDYTLMEKFVKEEREYVINILKAIKKSGANLLVIQKSIMRESCSELAFHFLKKLGISVINGVERKDVDYICKKLNIEPISDVDLIKEPVVVNVKKVRDMICFENIGCSIVISGCDQTVVDEVGRSLNDSLSVIKTLMEDSSIVPGGCSIETGVACVLDAYMGPHSFLVKEISEAFVGMPYLLAQNAGIYPIEVIASLRKNILINKNVGISLRTGSISDMVNDDSVIQPSLVSKSMICLAIETAQMLVRIDDILPAIN